MEVVVGLILVVALATLLKLGIRRVFRGPGYRQREAQAAGEAEAEARVKPGAKSTPRGRTPTGRTTPKGTRRR